MHSSMLGQKEPAMSTISAVAPAGGVQASPSSKPLIKAADGDYTAASIAANPGSAVGKIREADGDYRRIAGPAAQTSTAAQIAISTLTKGG
jgi:hypothetical protein